MKFKRGKKRCLPCLSHLSKKKLRFIFSQKLRKSNAMIHILMRFNNILYNSKRFFKILQDSIRFHNILQDFIIKNYERFYKIP